MCTCSSHRIARVAFLLCAGSLVGVLGGCSTVQGLLGAAAKPGLRVVKVSLKDINLTSATLLFDVEVSNPYPVSLPLVNMDYSLASGGKAFATGRADLQGTVPAGKSIVAPMPVTVSYLDTLSALSYLRPGQVFPYQAELGLSVNAPQVGMLRLPIKKDGELPIPAVPNVSLSDIQWKGLTADNATALLHLKVGNLNQFPVDLSALTYALTLANQQVGSAQIQKAVAFAAGAENDVEIPLSFSPRSLGFAAVNMLSGQGANYKLAGTMNLNSRFGPITVPYEKVGETLFKR